jgi:hypothetical protein
MYYGGSLAARRKQPPRAVLPTQYVKRSVLSPGPAT